MKREDGPGRQASFPLPNTLMQLSGILISWSGPYFPERQRMSFLYFRVFNILIVRLYRKDHVCLPVPPGFLKRRSWWGWRCQNVTKNRALSPIIVFCGNDALRNKEYEGRSDLWKRDGWVRGERIIEKLCEFNTFSPGPSIHFTKKGAALRIIS